MHFTNCARYYIINLYESNRWRSFMDNNLLVNNPLTPYLQPTAEKGLICYVEDFEEFRKMPHTNGNDYIGVTRNLKYIFIKRVSKEGNVVIGTFDPNQIPNPVPVTELQLADRIEELKSNIDNRISKMESQMNLICQKIMGGIENESGTVLQQPTTASAPAKLSSKEPVFRQ